ncbi:MAG: sensor histidine kinase N-terminal domain-containing protein [Pirellulales bacterium]
MSSRNDSSRLPALRTRLLLGQLTTLALATLGFGIAIYIMTRQSVYREVESDLLGAAQLIAQDLRVHRSNEALEIDRAYRRRFGAAPRDHAYFAIWDANRKQLAGSDPLPPHVEPLTDLPEADGHRPFTTKVFEEELQLAMRGPEDTQILIGRPLAKEFDRLRRLAYVLFAVGAATLSIGGFVAWRLARRLARPLEDLAFSMEGVSATELNRRPSIKPVTREDARLATVFDAMLERLRRAFERQTRFTADASHELRHASNRRLGASRAYVGQTAFSGGLPSSLADMSTLRNA